MPLDAGQDNPNITELQDKIPTQVFKGAQQAIDAVGKDKALSVWGDYYDEFYPSYITFFDPQDAARFDQTVEALKNLPLGPDGADEAEGLVGQLKDLAPGYNWGIPQQIYKGGEWMVQPKTLLDDEADAMAMDEDYDWFEAQAEGFRRMDEGDYHVPANEPWRGELQAKAMEIAQGDGRGHPEEADFNTAQILMGEKVPQKERDRLQRDLQAIEEGRSSSDY